MSLFRRHVRTADVWYSLTLVGLAAGCAALGTLAIVYTAWQLFWNLINSLAASSTVETSGRNPLPYLVFAAPLAATLLAPISWWVLIIWRGRLSPLRGGGAGALVGLFGHPFMWGIWYTLLVFMAPDAIRNPFTGGPINYSFTDLPAILVEGVFSVAFYTVASLLLTGWLTVVVGAGSGALIAAAQKSFGCRERWRVALATPF